MSRRPRRNHSPAFKAKVALAAILWQQPEDVVREGWDAVMAGKPVCVPGTVNKMVTGSLRPLPVRLQYFLGRTMNPLKEQ